MLSYRRCPRNPLRYFLIQFTHPSICVGVIYALTKIVFLFLYVKLSSGAKPGSKIRENKIRLERLLEAFFALFI
jgi:hypothetical protein